MRKAFSVFMVLLASALLTAGGSKEENTITIWHQFTGAHSEMFDEILDGFNETIGKDIGVTAEGIYQGAANDVLTKVKAAAGTSELPDIAAMDATACLDMKESDYLITADEAGIDKSILLPAAVRAFTSDRGLLAVPFCCSSLILYYNKTVFNEAGAEPPATLDDFTVIAPLIGQKDSEGNVTRYAFAGTPTTYELGAFIGAQNGLSYMVDGKNGHFGVPRNVLIETDGTFRNFLVHWKQFYDTGFVLNTSDQMQEFAAGRSASMLNASDRLPTLQRLIGDRFEIATAFVPMTDENATGGVNIGGSALFMFSDSEAVEAFMDYILSLDCQRSWAESTGYLPATSEVYSDPDFQKYLEENPLYRTAVEQTLASNPEVTGIWMPSGYQIYHTYQSEIREVTENGKDIDQAVHDMASFIQLQLDDYARQNTSK